LPSGEGGEEVCELLPEACTTNRGANRGGIEAETLSPRHRGRPGGRLQRHRPGSSDEDAQIGWGSLARDPLLPSTTRGQNRIPSATDWYRAITKPGHLGLPQLPTAQPAAPSPPHRHGRLGEEGNRPSPPRASKGD
jgi:hypothetical protein